jgi:hypothetical protein
VIAAEAMVRHGGRLPTVTDNVLTDEEFEAIQRQHFGKKTDPAAQRRAAKSLASLLDAIAAFREICDLSPISQATPDDCTRFPRIALSLPKCWRKQPIPERKPPTYFEECRRRERQASDAIDELDKPVRFRSLFGMSE